MATSESARVPGAGERLEALRFRAGRTLLASPSFPVALLGVAVFIWFAGDEGGFRGTTWMPATLLLMALFAVGLWALPRPRPPRAVLVGIGLLAGYAAWSYLSILWADQQGIAWDGANRTALYAVVFAMFALWPMRGEPAAIVLGALGLGVAAVGLVELLRVGGAAQSIQYFHEGRLSEPTGYSNANVALWFTGFWPCIVLAGRREVPAVLRGLFLGSAVLLASLAVLGQSRGWLLTLPFVICLAVALVPGRGRTIAALAVVGIAFAVISSPVLDVYDAWHPKAPPGAAWNDAVRAILLASAALVAVGVLAALVDRRVRISEASARRVSGAVAAAFTLACVGALAGAAIAADHPVGTVKDRWEEFKTDLGDPQFGHSRLGTSLSSYRYDGWRVAWKSFERHPVAGVGADNFFLDYARRGRSFQTPVYPHSLEFRVLSQTGLVGVLLFVGALAAALAAALPALRRGGALGGAAAGAGVMVFVYWVVHGSVDWFFEVPGLGAPAFAMLGIATAVAASRRPERGRPLPGGRPAMFAYACLAVLLAVGITIPWLAERELRDGRAIAGSDPTAALKRLDRASKLNPLSPLPDAAAGVIETRLGHLSAAREHFRAALERDGGSSFSYLQLSAIASVEDQQGEALRLVGRARDLAPRDEVAKAVQRRLRRGGRVTPEQVNRLAVSDFDTRLGPE
jgi:O-antigen ligase